jgi:Swt1-like HEPN
VEADLYSFAFRGLLAEEALDKTARISRLALTSSVDADVARRLPILALDESLVARATRMAAVYVAIAAFENTVREFVSTRLLEAVGADWWKSAVSEKIRTRAEARQVEEAKVRWHAARGDEPLNYTEFGDLASIISQNWEQFEVHLETIEWVRHTISTVERSRNVIMHSGDLGLQDVERIGTAMRDWIRQVGA